MATESEAQAHHTGSSDWDEPEDEAGPTPPPVIASTPSDHGDFEAIDTAGVELLGELHMSAMELLEAAPASRPTSRLSHHQDQVDDVDGRGDAQPSTTLSSEKIADLLHAMSDIEDRVYDLDTAAAAAPVSSEEQPASHPPTTPLSAHRSSSPTTIQRTTADIEREFKSAVIPEMDIIDTPKTALVQTIHRLTSLRAEILDMDNRQSNTSTVVQNTRIALVEKIGREILLYEQFVDMDESRLQHTLEEIMREPIEDVDEVESVMLGSEASRGAPASLHQGLPFRSSSNRHVSIDGLRSGISLPLLTNRRRSSAVSSQLPSHYSHGSFTIPSLKSTDSLGTLQEDTVISVPPGPFDFLKWTQLRKMSVALFSGPFERQVGHATVLSVAGCGIAVGTSKAAVLLYDLAQNLLAILGDTSSAQSSLYGAVTCVCYSLDLKYVLVGHARGHVIVWDIARRSVFKAIAPITAAEQQSSRVDGHLTTASIIHIQSLSQSSFVSADDQGAAFYHAMTRGIVMSTVKSVRVHGRPLSNTNRPGLPTTIYAMAPLLAVSGRFPTDTYRLIAIATPYKMAIMSMKPVPQIQYRVSWNLSETDVSYRVDFGAARDIVNQPVRPGPGSDPLTGALKPVEIACLDWWSPLVQKDGVMMGAPKLAYSRRNRLSILSVAWTMPTETDRSTRRIQFVPSNGNGSNNTVVLDENILMIRWMTERTLLCLTRSEHLVAVNTISMQLMERVDISGFGLVIQPSFHKPLQAFNMPVELSYAGSVSFYKGRLVLLTRNSVCIGSLLPWSDRVAALIRVGNFRLAFDMAVSFYRDDGRFAGVGLPRNRVGIQQRVSEHVVSLILSYLSMSLSGYDADSDEDLTGYNQITETVFETCIAIDRTDILFDEIYDRYVDGELVPVYMACLEPLILSERLRVIPNTTVVRHLMSHFRSNNQLDRLEQILLHLDPSTFDIDHIVQFCRSHGLYQALVYVYNKAVGDFVTPILELLVLCQRVGNTDFGDGDERDPCRLTRDCSGVYILYVYLAYVLTGHAFPIGVLDHDTAVQAKSDIYSLILSPRCVRTQRVGVSGLTPTVVSVSREFGEESYPYMRVLIETDVRELVKALGTAFDDASLSSGVMWSDRIDLVSVSDSVDHVGFDGLSGSVGSRERLAQRGITRQLIIDVLLEITASMGGLRPVLSPTLSSSHPIVLPTKTPANGIDSVEDADGAGSASISSTVLVIYAFVARCYAKYRKYIRLPDNFLEHMLSTLCASQDAATKTEREVSILAILTSGNGGASLTSALRNQSDMVSVLDGYERAGLWRVYEHAARFFGKYGFVLRSYLNDDVRRHDAFQAIRDLVDGGALTYQQTLDVKQSVLDQLEVLVALDGSATAQLFSDFWPSEHSHVLGMLRHASQLAYAYLRGLVAPAAHPRQQVSVTMSVSTLIVNTMADTDDEGDHATSASRSRRRTKTRSRSRSHSRSPSASSPLRHDPRLQPVQDIQQSPTHPPEFYNEFIALMCRFDPQKVYPYFIYLSDVFETIPYDIHTVIDVVRTQCIPDAAAWILERSGDIKGALDVIMDEIEALMVKLKTAESVTSHEVVDGLVGRDETVCDAHVDMGLRQSVLSMLELAIGVCGRASIVLDEADQREMWFALLRRVYFKLSAREISAIALKEDVSPANVSVAESGSLGGEASDSRVLQPVGMASQSHRLALEPAPPLFAASSSSVAIHRRLSPPQMTDAESMRLLTTSDFLFELARRVMNAAIGHISLPEIIFQIVQAQRGARLESHRAMITSMLDSHVYYRELYRSATQIVSADTHRLGTLMHGMLTRGLCPVRGQCESCRRLLHVRAMFDHERDETIIVFGCHHAFHQSCLDADLVAAASAMGIDYPEDYGVWCPLCGRKKQEMRKSRKGKGKVASKSMPDLAHGFLDTPRLFDAKVAYLDRVQTCRTQLIDVYRSLESHVPSRLSEVNDDGEIVDINDLVQ